MRPPSSGKPGIRLKISTKTLIDARWPSTAVASSKPPISNDEAFDGVVGARERAAAAEADRGDGQRDQRPGDRHAELHAGRVGVALELRHAAEHPQVDARDRDPVADRHDGVPELVQQDREEEEQRA